MIITVLGLANIAGACDSARRTAINHESGEYASIQTAAHELGHKSVIFLLLIIFIVITVHVPFIF